MKKNAFTRWAMFAAMAALFLCGALPVRAAKTLPPEVSEMVRQLGEMRDLCWGLLSEARLSYTNNGAALVELNRRYIEASAAANSLIEQLEMELAARTTLQPKRYQVTVQRTVERCQALTNEWHRLMVTIPKTRGGTNSSLTAGSPNKPAGAKPANATLASAGLTDPGYDSAQKAVGIADGLIGLITKQRKALRDLDAEQRADVRKLLVQRKWTPLEGPPASVGTTNTNKPPAVKSANSNL